MKKIIIFLLFFLSCKEEKISIDTTLRITGNTPFLNLSFYKDEKEFRIKETLFHKYKSLAYKNVRITGSLREIKLESPDGKIKRNYFEIIPDTIIVLN